MRRYPLADTRARLAADPEGIPRCDCGRPLKPDVVLFGELLDEDAMSRASALAERAERLAVEGAPVAEHQDCGVHASNPPAAATM
jgi:NAD-dependent deacetylase